jgi:hypothetical protein
MRKRYGRLPRWAQWTIPAVVALAIIGAATSSPSKKHAGSTQTAVAHTPAGTRSIESPSQMARAKALYIAQVDASCVRLQKQYGKQEGEQATKLEKANVESLEGKEEAIKAVEVFTVIAQTRTRQFQSLTPPPSERTAVSKLLTNRKEELAHLKVAAEALATTSPKTAREALEVVKSDNEEYGAMVQAYGFRRCSPA